MRGAARVGLDAGRVGLELEYQHRLNDAISLFGQGWAGLAWQDGHRDVAAEVLAGVRWVF